MENWEIFENESLEHLQTNYENNGTKFKSQGGSDSTIADIEVLKEDGQIFFMETKMPEAQSGQFVLLEEDDKFIFSSKNKSESNLMTDSIKKYINDNYAIYKNVGTAPIKIDLPSSYFSSWIINYYQNKGVKFVISKFQGDFVIIPIEKFAKYFEISAFFRRKKSGSSALPKKYISNVVNFFPNCQVNTIGNKSFLHSSTHQDKEQFPIGGINIQLSLKAPEVFEIRKLGTANNPNVIFGIKCKKRQEQSDLELFKSKI